MNEKELKNIAPTLFKLKKLSNAFLTPKDYFDAVERDVEVLLFQTRIGNKKSFATPANYFEDIEDVIINKLQLENNAIPIDYFDTIEDKVFDKLNKDSKIISIKQTKKKWVVSIAVAASIALLITLQITTNSKNLDIASLKSSEIENWIANGELDLNTYEISSVYDDVNIDNFDIYNSYNDEDLLDYLEDVNVESLILTN